MLSQYQQIIVLQLAKSQRTFHLYVHMCDARNLELKTWSLFQQIRPSYFYTLIYSANKLFVFRTGDEKNNIPFEECIPKLFQKHTVYTQLD